MAKKKKSAGKKAVVKLTRSQARAKGMDFSDAGCPFASKAAPKKKAGKKK